MNTYSSHSKNKHQQPHEKTNSSGDVVTPFTILLKKMRDSKLYTEDLQDEMRLQIMEDLEQIYSMAREAGKLSVALKAKELQGKYLKMFESRKQQKAAESGVNFKSFADMNVEELHNMLADGCKDAGIDMHELLRDLGNPPKNGKTNAGGHGSPSKNGAPPSL